MADATPLRDSAVLWRPGARKLRTGGGGGRAVLGFRFLGSVWNAPHPPKQTRALKP